MKLWKIVLNLSVMISIMITVLMLGTDFASAQGEESVIILGTIEGSSIIKPGMPYVHKIFDRIHIKSIEQTVPAERAVSMANTGETDADPYRIEGLEKDYPNLIRVPGPLYLTTIVASSTNPKLKIDGWDSLKSYRICARLGIKAVEERVKGMNVSFSRSTKSQAQMLLRGRCDVMIHHRGEWMEINRAQIGGLYELSPPLEQRNLYLYVNKKHADLVPRLAEAIEKMREEGQWAELNNKIEADIAEAKAEVIKRGQKKIPWPYVSPKTRQRPPPIKQPAE